MRKQRKKHLFRGILAGVAGGLVAAWTMNVFMAGPGKKLQESLQTDEENREEQQTQGEQEDDATMKTADAVVNAVTGGQHLSHEGREKAGPVVHYSFGALMGGVYGGLAEYSPAVRSGFGTSFGSALFTGADLVAIPAFRLGPSPTEEPAAKLASPFAAHLVYGVTTELVRRLVRSML
jgi:putative membrane protein